MTWDDTAVLKEDVKGHTLAILYTHADGRFCGYHSRLGKWVTGWQSPLECLRVHADG